ncbi:enoyl-CoA delta isomerase 2, peroxisomal-like [Vicia villosa]|uniref:enoyl-CoA delta isomerase 2, peroxisomal-like n=1 Tax=Vicia villosa TaxID=3911 RepID=UPI00273B3900|nr:enoyl-CoA delta isomerase 2, peroxisomal-like [Vicia villosa]
MCSLEKRENLWILTITGDDQNRLNPTLIDSLLSTITNLATQSSPGSVLITTAKGKFFSNGFDLLYARAAGSKTAAAVRLQSMVDSFICCDVCHGSADASSLRIAVLNDTECRVAFDLKIREWLMLLSFDLNLAGLKGFQDVVDSEMVQSVVGLA